MSYGLYISAEGAMAQSQRLETIANNLANVDTAGFKRDLAIFQARNAEAIDQGFDFPGSGSINDVGGGVTLQATLTDHSQGGLKNTEVATDVALRGEGFFEVQKGDQRLLTRAGNFTLTSEGALVTQQGFPVLNDTGTPLVIDPALGPWTIGVDGGIQQGSEVNYLSIVLPGSPADLVKVGENLFLPLSETAAIPAGQRQVASGYLELSGVKPTTEMIEMIEASRAFEANVNLIRNQDQMFGQLISRLLRAA